MAEKVVTKLNAEKTVGICNMSRELLKTTSKLSMGYIPTYCMAVWYFSFKLEDESGSPCAKGEGTERTVITVLVLHYSVCWQDAPSFIADTNSRSSAEVSEAWTVHSL